MNKIKDQKTQQINDARIDAMEKALNPGNFSVRFIAQYIGVSEQSVWSWISKDKIPDPIKEKKYFEYLKKSGKEL